MHTNNAMSHQIPKSSIYLFSAILILTTEASYAAFDIAPYFGLNPGNVLSYRTKPDSGGTWTAGEHSVIGNAVSFAGVQALQRKWFAPGVNPDSGQPSSTEYLNISNDQICLYGISTPTQTITLNPGAAPGVCFSRSVEFGINDNRTISVKINDTTFNNVNYNISLPTPGNSPNLEGTYSTVYMVNGFSLLGTNITNESWLAYGTGVIRRHGSQLATTSELTAFAPKAGDVCNNDSLVVNTTTFNTTTYGPGEYNWFSGQSITTQGDVQLQTGADVVFRSPILHMTPGFRVAVGASFNAQSGAVTCPNLSGESFVVEPGVLAKPASEASLTSNAVDGPQPIARLDLAPIWLRKLLAAQGIDSAIARHALLDAYGQWLLFETTQDMYPVDGNGTSDIYLLDFYAGTLTLLSHTPLGMAGNGPSRYPSADSLGTWVTFQSDADDLTNDDLNGVTDVFLYDLSLGQLRRITSEAEYASSQPTTKTSGEDLVYDQNDPAGHRQIITETLWGDAPAEALSLVEDDKDILFDNHHPAISPAGQFIAYLEESDGVNGPLCQVHFYDRDSGRYQRQPCPSELAAASEDARPYFTHDGTYLAWYLPNLTDPFIVPNPLAESKNKCNTCQQ